MTETPGIWLELGDFAPIGIKAQFHSNILLSYAFQGYNLDREAAFLYILFSGYPLLSSDTAVMARTLIESKGEHAIYSNSFG